MMAKRKKESRASIRKRVILNLRTMAHHIMLQTQAMRTLGFIGIETTNLDMVHDLITGQTKRDLLKLGWRFGRDG